MVPALLCTLEEVKQEWAGSGRSSEGAEKAMKADAIMGKVYNTNFLLSLSALVDIYTVYSSISNNFQVRLLIYKAECLCEANTYAQNTFTLLIFSCRL